MGDLCNKMTHPLIHEKSKVLELVPAGCMRPLAPQLPVNGNRLRKSHRSKHKRPLWKKRIQGGGSRACNSNQREDT